MRRVVITGAGTVNPLGNSVKATLSAMAEGRCAIGPLDLRDADRLSVRIGAQVTGLDPERHFDRQQLSLYDPFTLFSMLSAEQAIAQSGLKLDALPADRSGVVLGTAAGGVQTWDESYRTVLEEGRNRVHPFVVPRLMNNAAASHVSIRYGLTGPSFTVSTACASSNHAMGLAFQMIRSGSADLMITGGSESILCFGGMKAWEGMRVMSRTGCRPFCVNRDGLVMGEGAAVFVFETLESAKRRGADILAEVIGSSMTSDASDIVRPASSGAVRAMRGALTDARINVQDVGYLNAHGTATRENDRSEAAAILEVFGSAASTLPVSSTKAMHGHLMGGTGAVELLACIMALRDGILAPTIGYEGVDPECALDVVPNSARDAVVNVALSNAFAFGGFNAVLALRSFR